MAYKNTLYLDRFMRSRSPVNPVNQITKQVQCMLDYQQLLGFFEGYTEGRNYFTHINYDDFFNLFESIVNEESLKEQSVPDLKIFLSKSIDECVQRKTSGRNQDISELSSIVHDLIN